MDIKETLCYNCKHCKIIEKRFGECFAACLKNETTRNANDVVFCKYFKKRKIKNELTKSN